MNRFEYIESDVFCDTHILDTKERRVLDKKKVLISFKDIEDTVSKLDGICLDNREEVNRLLQSILNTQR